MITRASRGALRVIIVVLCIWTVRSAHGQVWTGASIIDAGEQNSWTPMVAFDESGSAIAVFLQTDGLYGRIYANH